MYDNLQKINLTEYLNKCCGGTNWVKESWLVFLDSYVGLLSKENTNILKLKINNNLNHYQINDKGKIYLIYDYNTLTSENIGTKKEPRFTRTHRSALSKDDIKNEINNFLNNFSKNHPQITVEAIYFGDLRDKVINSK